MLTNEDQAQLAEFTSKAWGQPRAFIKDFGAGEAKFEYIDLGDYFSPFEKLFAGALKRPTDMILVRQEYRDAFQELETETYYDGACVMGQPGIGKTLFQVYILVKRLGEKKAVAIQFMNGQHMYALFRATVDFYSLDDVGPLDVNSLGIDPPYNPPFVWALCDSNSDVQLPAGVFKGQRSTIRIIQTTSPKESRWKEWTKQHGAHLYIMDIWSENEIRQLGLVSGRDVDRMISLAKKWGSIPRTLLDNLKSSDKLIERAYHQGAEDAISKTQQFMAAEATKTLPSDPLLPFFFLRPLNPEEGGISRSEPSVNVGTKTLWEFLGQALQDIDDQITLTFYRVLSNHKHTRTSAGNIFESWFHSFVVARGQVSCTWLSQHGAKLPKTWKLPDDGGARHKYVITGTASLQELDSAPAPYYWVPPDSFPGIDGLLVLETAICAFQVTISSTHRAPEAGVEKIPKKLRAKLSLKHVPFGVVFVGLQEDTIKNVAQKWQGRVRLSKKTLVPIAWSVVNPAPQGVEYRLWRDVDAVREFDEHEQPGVAGQAEQLENQTAQEDQAGTSTKRKSARIAGVSDKLWGKQRKID